MDKSALKSVVIDDLDVFRNYVVEFANGIEPHRKDSIFNFFKEQMQNPKITSLFDSFDKEFKKPGLFAGNSAADKTVRKYLEEIYTLAYAERFPGGKELLESARKDPQMQKMWMLEAQHLNKGTNLIGNELVSKEIQALRNQVSSKNEVIQQLDKKVSLLETKLKTITKAYSTLVENVKAKFKLNEKDIQILKTPATTKSRSL